MKLSETPPQQSLEFDEHTTSEELKAEKPKVISKNSKNLPTWLLAILLLASGAVLGRVSTLESVPTAQTSTEKPSPKAVQTIALSRGTAQRQIELLGRIEAGERATLSSQLDGTVQKVLVKEGDRVTTICDKNRGLRSGSTGF